MTTGDDVEATQFEDLEFEDQVAVIQEVLGMDEAAARTWVLVTLGLDQEGPIEVPADDEG